MGLTVKTRRTISAVLVAAVLLICLTGCYTSPYRQGPAMWVVEDEAGNRVYLFGSIHVADKTMFPFADIIEDAYDASEYIAVEYDIVAAEEKSAAYTPEELAAYFARFRCEEGTTIKDRLSVETYEKAVDYLTRKGIYNSEYDNYTPAYWDSIVTQYMTEDAGYDYLLGVDRYFLNKAHEEGKPVLEVESEDFQLDMILSFKDEVYEYNLSGMLNSEKSVFGMKFSLSYMSTIYKRGDMDSMTSLAVTQPKDAAYPDTATSEAMKEYNEKMMTERNAVMAETVKTYLSEGKTVFFVVGCAHMLGTDGIVSLLTQEGLTVYRK